MFPHGNFQLSAFSFGWPGWKWIQLEKIEPTFSSSSFAPSLKSVKIDCGTCFFENSPQVVLLVVMKQFMSRARCLHMNLAHFRPKIRKMAIYNTLPLHSVSDGPLKLRFFYTGAVHSCIVLAQSPANLHSVGTPHWELVGEGVWRDEGLNMRFYRYGILCGFQTTSRDETSSSYFHV